MLHSLDYMEIVLPFQDE